MNGLNTWSFVNHDGTPTGRTFTGPAHALEANTPPGCQAVQGIRPVDHHDDPELRRARMLDRIADLERRQLRPLRELRLDAGNDEALRRLIELDQQIAQIRLQIQASPRQTASAPKVNSIG